MNVEETLNHLALIVILSHSDPRVNLASLAILVCKYEEPGNWWPLSVVGLLVFLYIQNSVFVFVKGADGDPGRRGEKGAKGIRGKRVRTKG